MSLISTSLVSDTFSVDVEFGEFLSAIEYTAYTDNILGVMRDLAVGAFGVAALSVRLEDLDRLVRFIEGIRTGPLELVTFDYLQAQLVRRNMGSPLSDEETFVFVLSNLVGVYPLRALVNSANKYLSQAAHDTSPVVTLRF